MSMPFPALPEKPRRKVAEAQPCAAPIAAQYDRQFAAVSHAIEEARHMVAAAAGVSVDKVVIKFTG